nr:MULTISPECIES: sugar ABC transporter permease [unclassified Oceanispirochaeta]
MSENLKFIGLQNFKDIFQDSSNLLFFRNTFLYAISTSILKVLIGLFLALLLNEGIRSRNILRAVFFLPVIISNIIVGLMFQQVFHPTTGILNLFFKAVGFDFLVRGWLQDPNLVMWSCISVEVWKAAGFSMAIFLAGLQSIPKELYEACEIDGSNYWNKLIRITVPFLQSSILINVLLSLISGFKVFDVIYALTNGGPGRASEVINITIFSHFSLGDYGYGSALGTIMFIFMAIMSIGIIKIFRKTEVETQ